MTDTLLGLPLPDGELESELAAGLARVEAGLQEAVSSDDPFVADASRYLVEVVREDGTAVATLTTFDTTATLALTTPLPSGERLSWWVTATLADGTTRRSAPALLRAR